MPICTGILSYTFIHLYTYVYITIVNEKIGQEQEGVYEMVCSEERKGENVMIIL